jgi:hypothetical protein
MQRLQLICFALAFVSIAACREQADVSATPTSALDLSDTNVVRTFAFAAGTWDWHNGDSTCPGNTHTVRFSDDKRIMLLEFQEPLDTATGQRVARYRVVSAGSRVIPGLPYLIRAEMEGETRKTDAGALVVWDLILASHNRYHWHRTDWADGGVTTAIIRCDGRRPLEARTSPDS